MTNEIPYFQPAPEHTPGPWEVLARGTHGGLKVFAGSMLVATVARANLDFSFNARLIAAAPDLLEALQEAAALIEGVLMIHGTPEAGSTGHKVRAAIAKAIGSEA